ncbi:MAG: hypothetical protein ACOVLG_06680 [Flavobacterium sp.]
MRIKLIHIITVILFFISCDMREKSLNQIDLEDVNSIKIFKGYPEELIQVDAIISKGLLNDIKKIKEVQGPIKYAKTHRIIIHYKSNANDTLFTNGTIFSLKSCFYKSKENLILKYKI